ncbi:type 1 glutamine amidotransferase domain-containing protein [Agrococcus sp. 1P02AA]|uniref:type 1 glutamine amidotransferase domain-containing protein n=1 Tax=Agrococcus sp. 1P02AA TaxID=3132259 RepID=UPI0039A449A2
MADITGKKVAFVLTDGFEDSELTSPWEAVQGAGAQPTLVAPKAGSVEGKNGHSQTVDATVADVDASGFDALVLPGGVVNADHLRMDEGAVALVKGFVDAGKPIGVICHGAWILIEAGGVDGRTITSYPSLRTDLQNAGATWVDQEVATDKGLVSSRTPDDLPAFNAKVLEEIAEGTHAR